MILGEDLKPFASPEEALRHYGVRGMRWGVRKKYEPIGRMTNPVMSAVSETQHRIAKVVMPTVSEKQQKQQKKVDKFLKRADVMETRISELKVSNEALQGTRNLGKLYERQVNKDLIKQTEAQRKRALKDAEAVQNGKLTTKQKQVVAGAVVVGAIVGYSLVVRGQQSGAFNSWKLMGQARLGGQKIPFNVNKELSKSMSASDLLNKVAKPVNPGYSKMGGKMNCRRSTYAYELRRRGFDVHATTSAVGWGQSESGVINALTTEGRDYFRRTSLSTTVQDTGMSGLAKGDKRVPPGAKILLDGLDREDRRRHSVSSSKKVLEELAKQPNGARGEVLFKFASFGHSMAYEVVNGVPHIFDSQKGTLYNASTKMVESKWDGFTAAEIRRLDNVELDINFLTRWATNRGQ